MRNLSKSKDSALKQLQKNMTTKDINQMDFRELRNEVQSLKDTLTRALRTYEDLLYNLDDDNFSSKIIKEKNDMKTQITVTADGLSAQITAISDQAEQLSQLSTDISVQAGEIETVTKRVSDTETNITNIKAGYDAISTQVETIEDDLVNYSTITQTADKIASIVAKTWDLNSAIKLNSETELPDVGNNNIYVVSGNDYNGNYIDTYYYYDESLSEWRILSGNSIYSAFEQTPTGFFLKGNVTISGDLITEGIISADRIDVNNLRINKLYSLGETNNRYICANSMWGELGAYKNTFGQEERLWSITPSEFGAVSFYQKNNLFLDVYGNSENRLEVSPRGIWDFTFCEEVKLPDSIIGGVVAVFG